MKALVSVTFDQQLAVHDIKVIYAKDKHFIVMPSKQRADGAFHDLVHPINKEFRAILEDAVISRYFKALEEAENVVNNLTHKDFIIQEFISESRGRDVRVNVVGGRVVSAMERYNENDFRSNISNGGKMKQIELSEEMAEVAIKATEVIGLDFAGVDVMFGKDGPVVCEVNSNPHFKSSLECTGVDMSEEIMDYIVEQMR